MYTRRFDGCQTPPSGYSGSFITAEKPSEPASCPQPEPICTETDETASRYSESIREVCQNEPGREPRYNDCRNQQSESRGGLLSGFLSRLKSGFELDDLLLIGLLLLLIGERDGDSGDELLLVLGLLLFMGF